LGSLAARGKKCPFVGFQQVNPGGDITGIADIPIKAEFRAKEGCPQLGNQFLRGIIARAEPVF
jgi:hypothetical protein